MHADIDSCTLVPHDSRGSSSKTLDELRLRHKPKGALSYTVLALWTEEGKALHACYQQHSSVLKSLPRPEPPKASPRTRMRRMSVATSFLSPRGRMRSGANNPKLDSDGDELEPELGLYRVMIHSTARAAASMQSARVGFVPINHAIEVVEVCKIHNEGLPMLNSFRWRMRIGRIWDTPALMHQLAAVPDGSGIARQPTESGEEHQAWVSLTTATRNEALLKRMDMQPPTASWHDGLL